MARSQFGGALAKYLLLLLAVGALAGLYMFSAQYGRIGTVSALPASTQNQICFVRQEGGVTNIYTVGADGTGLSQLTNDKSAKRAPAWSPDGKRICYAAEPESAGAEGRAFQLFLVGEGRPRQATYGSLSKDAPQWRPDGKVIAFLTGGAIKVVEPNGNNMKQIYPPPFAGTGGSEGGGPQDTEDTGTRPPISAYKWAPNSVSMAAIQIMEGETAVPSGKGQWWEKGQSAHPDTETPGVVEPESAILLPKVDVEKPRFLPGTGANHVGLAWFPDSSRLAVSVSTRLKNHAILVYRTDDPGGTPSGLFASQGYTLATENPAVSPDGKYVAAEAWRMESPENRQLLGLTVLPADNGLITVNGPKDLGRVPLRIKGEVHDPQWSPDGSRILYWAYGTSGRDLWVANADGSQPVNITKGAGDNFDASWSPARR